MPSERAEDPGGVQAQPHDRHRRGWVRARAHPAVRVRPRPSPPPSAVQAHTLTARRSSFLKRPGSTNIPIQAIGLSLYENLGSDGPVEAPGTKVTRTQWLDLSSLEMASLVGKNILIVDEVDDTRTTLEYAVRELQKDVETAAQKLGRADAQTNFTIFVLHVHPLPWRPRRCDADGAQNKDKSKKGKLPEDMLSSGRYLAAQTVGDIWICYPWEATYVAALPPDHALTDHLAGT